LFSSVRIYLIFIFGQIDLTNIYLVHIRYGFAGYSAYIQNIFEYQAPNIHYLKTNILFHWNEYIRSKSKLWIYSYSIWFWIWYSCYTGTAVKMGQAKKACTTILLGSKSCQIMSNHVKYYQILSNHVKLCHIKSYQTRPFAYAYQQKWSNWTWTQVLFVTHWRKVNSLDPKLVILKKRF
jgi:hypothetical protein